MLPGLNISVLLVVLPTVMHVRIGPPLMYVPIVRMGINWMGGYVMVVVPISVRHVFRVWLEVVHVRDVPLLCIFIRVTATAYAHQAHTKMTPTAPAKTAPQAASNATAQAYPNAHHAQTQQPQPTPTTKNTTAISVQPTAVTTITE